MVAERQLSFGIMPHAEERPLYDAQVDGILKPGEALLVFADGSREKVAAEPQGKPKAKSANDKWIASDMIFVTAGQCFGVAADGSTVCIGAEEAIETYLLGGIMPENIQERAREVLIWIKDFLKEANSGRADEVKPASDQQPIKTGGIRTRPAANAQHKPVDTRHLKAREKLPLRKS